MGNIFNKKKKIKTKSKIDSQNRINELEQQEINDTYDYFLYKKYQIERPNRNNYSFGYNVGNIYY
ncbi:putative ORFan [Tupanvirus deep ocean]|uniref:ORFan n=2 Tax=Tupanvirus TaxID=2094720 RepID=A0AC62A7P7_9VIRU|nr:putative ORFan [Tupanvirus deep ocean]QKU33703.1 putative ORFan [Tupanvirus deep ocean]